MATSPSRRAVAASAAATFASQRHYQASSLVPAQNGIQTVSSLISVCASEITSAEPPEWIELIPAGRFTAVDGRGTFENPDPDSIVAASIAKMPQAGLVVDYNHSTDLAAPEGRPSPAAGWIKQFKVENGAIFARVEWTQEAAEALREKKYRYISPVFNHNEDGRVTCILRAGVTNNPALAELAAIASAQLPIPKSPSPAHAGESDLKAQSMACKETMAEGEEKSLGEIVAGLEVLFPQLTQKQILQMAIGAIDGDGDGDDAGTPAGDEGMAADGDPYENEDAEQMARRHEEEMARCASDGERAECARRHAAEKERFARRQAAAAPQNKGLEVQNRNEKMAARIDRLVARHPMVVAMAGQINEMRAAQAKACAIEKVDAAIREGRLIPSQREWAVSYCAGDERGFQKFIGAQPKIIQTGSDGTFTGRVGEPPQGAALFSQKQIEIFANLGLETEEQIQKCAAVQQKWTLKFPRPRLMLDDSNTGRSDSGAAQ